ncbi:hypothetical protein XA68_13434 [Ophiocordyceps unilateralis]|uniref:Uncharacterized protein n=1 Tax=Ophiocordyceps unilateralis TaxID=268505 RepID=A0A2A9PCA9_OPHUN|nr:hypothetical protein XA68_13434 [Ophiocordyceps unilateralis]
MLAADAAWHIDPQIVALVVAGGIVDDPNKKPKLLPKKFDLRSVGLASWGILHDCSFTRPDRGGPSTDFFRFSPEPWRPALFELFRRVFSQKAAATEQTPVDVTAMGAAKVARIQAGCNYTVAAAAHGVIEVGMLLCALGGNEATVGLKHVRALFEHEVILADAPARPEMSCGVDIIVGLGVKTLMSNVKLQTATNGNLTTAEASFFPFMCPLVFNHGILTPTQDIRSALGRADPDNLIDLRKTIIGLGYDDESVADLDKRIRAQGFGGRL